MILVMVCNASISSLLIRTEIAYIPITGMVISGSGPTRASRSEVVKAKGRGHSATGEATECVRATDQLLLRTLL